MLFLGIVRVLSEVNDAFCKSHPLLAQKVVTRSACAAVSKIGADALVSKALSVRRAKAGSLLNTIREVNALNLEENDILVGVGHGYHTASSLPPQPSTTSRSSSAAPTTTSRSSRAVHTATSSSGSTATCTSPPPAPVPPPPLCLLPPWPLPPPPAWLPWPEPGCRGQRRGLGRERGQGRGTVQHIIYL